MHSKHFSQSLSMSASFDRYIIIARILECDQCLQRDCQQRVFIFMDGYFNNHTFFAAESVDMAPNRTNRTRSNPLTLGATAPYSLDIRNKTGKRP